MRIIIYLLQMIVGLRHLPEIILGDRGELEGYNVNHLIEGLNITIENNPSFRPDWKGIVEKLFDTSQEKYGHFTWVCFKRLKRAQKTHV